jgi:hypothetical protein
MLNIKSLFPAIVALPLIILAGCPNKTSNYHLDGQADLDAGVTDAHMTANGPLGDACASNADCASGFCADGVCCDSACGQTCYACDQQAAPGHCAALASGEDPTATTACAAPSACFVPPSSAVPVCKLVDGTACQTDGDCVSGHCLTYYLDADGDGYGGSDEAHFCAALNGAPPSGYAAYTGDCCDLDAGANPGFDSSQFLSMPDACGSFDWNCDGKEAQQKSCPTPVACGAACNINLGFFVYDAFTEACN